MFKGSVKAEYYDRMGGDLNVVDAARVSFSKASEWDIQWSDLYDEELTEALQAEGWTCTEEDWDSAQSFWRKLKAADTKLIKYLAEHHHDIPFAHTAITVRCEAPIPVRTQCFKHKVGFVENEESRRYISSTPQLYIPDVFRAAVKDKKQGSGGKHEDSDRWQMTYIAACSSMIQLYESMIEKGVCPEQARFVLPQGVTVNWMWTGSLLAFARFYNLRSKPDAQHEVQLMAAEIDRIIRPLFPVAWSALVD